MERRTIRGVHFIRVRGTVEERGRAHAHLLKNEIANGALQALATKNEWVIRRSPGLASFKPAQAMILWFYRRILMKMLDRNNPEEVRSMMRAMSKESGIPYEVYLHSLFQADGLMLLCRISVMKYTLGDLPLGAMPACTSAVALKEMTASGRLLACRNQDYPMVGPWEKNTTVVFNEPSETGHIPHVGVTTAGVHTAGLTSINREGLTLFTHAHFGRNVSLSGMPVIDIGNEIIRKAKTIDQAIDIARKCKPYANWAFIVSSARENDAVVLETTPKRLEVRHASEGFLAHSNYFHAPSLQAEEALISGGCKEDLQGRFCRMRDLLESKRGVLTPSDMAATLGDPVDALTGEERVLGNTISVVTTVKSAVFDPGAQKFWVSSRHETPMGLGEFLEVDVDRFWDSSADAVDDANWPCIQGHRPTNPALLEGIRHYREAYRAHHMESHFPDYRDRTLAALRKAVQAYPQDGNLWIQTGVVAFRMQKFDEAQRALERACGMKLTKHVEGVRDLYRARCRDIAGDRTGALELYRQVSETDNPTLGKAVTKGIRRPYRARETSSMLLDLQFPDTIHY